MSILFWFVYFLNYYPNSSAGVFQLKDSGIEEVVVDPSGCPLAAAEGAYLSSWSYKDSDRKKFPAKCDAAGSTSMMCVNVGSYRYFYLLYHCNDSIYIR